MGWGEYEQNLSMFRPLDYRQDIQEDTEGRYREYGREEPSSCSKERQFHVQPDDLNTSNAPMDGISLLS